MSKELPHRGHLSYAEVFTIFSKYEPDEICTIEPAHDIIYSCAIHPEKMDEEDVQRLGQLGWSWDESFDCWSCFT